MGTFNDESIMPFGKHIGSKLCEVPADHLMWLFENDRAGRIEQYILEHWDDIMKRMPRAKDIPPCPRLRKFYRAFH